MSISFNFISMTAVAPRAAAESQFAAKGGAAADEFCGTTPPHPPIARPLEAALRHSRFEQVMLNPQPLPPRSDHTAVAQQAGRVALDDDWCGTGPKPLPPMPPRLGGVLADLVATAPIPR